MSDTEQKAQSLFSKVLIERGALNRNIDRDVSAHEALCRAIEQHEAFRQEVSFALKTFKDGNMHTMHDYLLEPFIIPAPKPDPLVEVLKDLSWDEETAAEEWAGDIRKALAARGLEIREKNDD